MKTKAILVFLIFLLPLFLAAQTDSLSTGERSLPVLNNHYFTPNSNFLSPFMTTFFKTGIGGGVSLNSIPIYVMDGEVLLGRLEGENTYVTADVHVQVEAKEWLAVWFRYQANARIGSSTPTILAHGVTAVTGFEFGWMLRLWHNKKSQLSGTITINNATVSAVNLSNFIKDIIDNPDSINTSLSRKKNPLDGVAGVRYAYSFSDMIGIQAFINASYGESLIKNNKNVWKFNTGILGSFNFIHSHDVPVGLNLGYTIQKFSLFEGQQEDNIQSFMFKVAYTGREEYNIGLEFMHVRTAAPLIEEENTIEYLSTAFVMVYYF
ncbi:MAG: hypothetical protein KAV45_13115 [Calditrichia bacterium]|nr:hypothetical protein [Calditrichia bacterium]